MESQCPALLPGWRLFFMTTTTGTQTLLNLNAAFDGESNAAARYALFAAKADKDGYHRVGSLFRAAARAEQIHAGNHAKVIGKMGGTPVTKLQPTTVGTTAENLKAAIAGEEHERDVMYPDFIKIAKEENCTAAIWTLDVARQAEAEHARLYRNALDTLDQQKTKTKFYVCLDCGYTTDQSDIEECPVCSNPRENFEVVE
jgi:rubrerythrin